MVCTREAGCNAPPLAPNSRNMPRPDWNLTIRFRRRRIDSNEAGVYGVDSRQLQVWKGAPPSR